MIFTGELPVWTTLGDRVQWARRQLNRSQQEGVS